MELLCNGKIREVTATFERYPSVIAYKCVRREGVIEREGERDRRRWGGEREEEREGVYSYNNIFTE